MKILTIILFFVLPLFSTAQGDMLLLRKKGKVIRSYYPGSTLYFDAGRGIQEAQISRMENDSLFLIQYQVRQVMTTLGIPRWDTVGNYRFALDYREILQIAEMPHGWNWNAAGATLFGGGTLLTAAGLLTWVFAKKDTRYYARPGFVAASAAAAAVGFLLLQTKSGKRFTIGEKYKLQYISTK